MTKIKIISNPYLKQIIYYIYDDAENQWKNIIENHDYTGKLQSEKMTQGFFPFIAEEVIREIIDEYDDSIDKIQLYFEGTPDEYKDLETVCEYPDIQNKIDLQPIGRYLNNAYQILPDIVDIFKKIRPIIQESICTDTENKTATETDLAKFSDASNDIVPICVVGNYSAGKSTFINALIGAEILPSGDKAVTAKVYKIYQSKSTDCADVYFQNGTAKAAVHFSDQGFVLDGITEGSRLNDELYQGLRPLGEAEVSVRVNKALSVINGYNNDSEADKIGTIIEIHFPFVKGIWDEFPGRFVILDTPGSNAASHADHKQVLIEAMRGMSNGIPIYVSEYDALDSTDNEDLYDIIRQMDGLDSRFTMIIANKADSSNLPKNCFSEDEKEEILNEAVPRNLYSSGLYFVSAIMGLGSKNNGRFIDDHCDETFHLNERRYSDETNRYYKELYRYDIMPGQIKNAAVEAAEKEAGQERVYANSGLYTVERAIQTFAKKYASYNKCRQSQMFLGRIIARTKNELIQSTQDREAAKKAMEERLEKNKREMIQSVESSAASEMNSYTDLYAATMAETLDQAKETISLDELKEEEKFFSEEQKKHFQMTALKADAKKQTSDIKDALQDGFQELRRKPGLNAIKKLGSSVAKEVKEAWESSSAVYSTSREADKAAARDLIDKINVDFAKQVENAEKSIESAARSYLDDCSQAFREKLAEVVKSTTLTEEKKDEIANIIVNYRKLQLDTVEFRVDEFDYLFDIGKLKLLKMDKINLMKLREAYRTRISNLVDEIDHVIHDDFLNRLIEWGENLVNVVRTNIIDYSPELKEQQSAINKVTEHIHDLQTRQTKLQISAEKIQTMTDWKEN